MDIIVHYLDTIKLGSYIYLISLDRKCFHLCKVIKITKGKRRSRENGYPYTFTGEAEDNSIYTGTYYRDVRMYVPKYTRSKK
jgi:hypothetical protein